MTLVVAVVDRVTGAVHLGADSKVTWVLDETRTRRVYTEPALKLVLLGQDVAVGFAGDGPETLASAVANLVELPVDDVLEALAGIAGASFVVAQRDPIRIWSVSHERGIEDRTAIGRAWAGDTSVYSMFQARFTDFPEEPPLFQLQSTMQHLIHLAKPDSVGGYTILASASGDAPFRYLPLRSDLWPESADESAAVNVRPNADGTANFTLRASFAEGPLVLHVLPGTGPTPGALGLYVENAGAGYLYRDRAPALRLKIQASTVDAFARRAETDYRQSLSLTGGRRA